MYYRHSLFKVFTHSHMNLDTNNGTINLKRNNQIPRLDSTHMPPRYLSDATLGHLAWGACLRGILANDLIYPFFWLGTGGHNIKVASMLLVCVLLGCY